MKKQLAIIMAAVLAVSALTACGSSSGSETSAATEAATEATAGSEENTEAPAETDAEEESPVIVVADPDLGYEYPDLELGDGSLDKILEAGKIVMATSPDFAPNEFEDVSSGTTQYVGCDIDLANYIADQLGVELEIRAMEFSAILQAVQSGTVDMGISGFAYTEERNETMGLSHRYNRTYSKGYGAVVPKGKESDYQTPEDLAGMRVAAQNASLQYTLATTQIPDVDIQLVTNIMDGALMVATDKVDALAVAIENGESIVATYDELGIADFRFDYEDAGAVIAVKKGNNDLLNAINDIVDDVEANGYYNDWKDAAIELANSLGIEVEE